MCVYLLKQLESLSSVLNIVEGSVAVVHHDRPYSPVQIADSETLVDLLSQNLDVLLLEGNTNLLAFFYQIPELNYSYVLAI